MEAARKKGITSLYLEEQGNENSTNFDLDGQTKVTRAYKAAIKAVTIEEDGPLALTIKAEVAISIKIKINEILYSHVHQ